MDAEQKQRIGTLYVELYDTLLAYAHCALGIEALAEEAVQETFRIACQKSDALCTSPNPRGWLVLTLKNTVRNTRKSRATAKRIVDRYIMTHAKELSISEDQIPLDVLYTNVACTEEFKLLAELALEGKSHKEMAYARGITVDACKKRVQYAKEKLQRKLKFVITR